MRDEKLIDQFRHIKIQPKTKDLSTRLWGINAELMGFYSPEPRAEVYCFRLNFNISKLVYCAGNCAGLHNLVSNKIFRIPLPVKL